MSTAKKKATRKPARRTTPEVKKGRGYTEVRMNGARCTDERGRGWVGILIGR